MYNSKVSQYNENVERENKEHFDKTCSKNDVTKSDIEKNFQGIFNKLNSTPIVPQHDTEDYWETKIDNSFTDGFQHIETVDEYIAWKENKESKKVRQEKTKPYKINSIYTKPLCKEALWKKGTILIVGDSLLYGIDEQRMRNTKV